MPVVSYSEHRVPGGTRAQQQHLEEGRELLLLRSSTQQLYRSSSSIAGSQQQLRAAAAAGSRQQQWSRDNKRTGGHLVQKALPLTGHHQFLLRSTFNAKYSWFGKSWGHQPLRFFLNELLGY